MKMYAYILLQRYNSLLMHNFFWQGSEKVIHHVNDLFPDMELLSLSGNFCTDKKPAAVNW